MRSRPDTTHALALLKNGNAMAWGDKTFGQLGNGTTDDSGAPALVPNLAGVRLLAVGATHALASFTGVSAANASDVWAVGNTQKGLTQVAVAAHWDGHSWRAFPVPQPGGGTTIFSGVLDS